MRERLGRDGGSGRLRHTCSGPAAHPPKDLGSVELPAVDGQRDGQLSVPAPANLLSRLGVHGADPFGDEAIDIATVVASADERQHAVAAGLGDQDLTVVTQVLETQ
jgi:hypothetical protein